MTSVRYCVTKGTLIDVSVLFILYVLFAFTEDPTTVPEIINFCWFLFMFHHVLSFFMPGREDQHISQAIGYCIIGATLTAFGLLFS